MTPPGGFDLPYWYTVLLGMRGTCLFSQISVSTLSNQNSTVSCYSPLFLRYICL